MIRIFQKVVPIVAVFTIYIILVNVIVNYITNKYNLNYKVHDAILLFGLLAYPVGVLSYPLMEKIYRLLG